MVIKDVVCVCVKVRACVWSYQGKKIILQAQAIYRE